MLDKTLQDLISREKQQNTPNFVIKNILKEYLQFPALRLIYSQPDYKQLIFTGGSCLRICYNMPRFSEGLDFDISSRLKKDLNLRKLADFIKSEFTSKYLLPVKLKIQKERIYLKFPILKSLKLAGQSESDWLYVKLEFSKSKFSSPELEVSPISRYGFNFVAKNYTLPFLMIGKIDAFLNRIWFKGKKSQVDIKGRDFYDLYWFLKQGVEPNWEILDKLVGINSKKEFKKVVAKRIEQVVSPQKLAYDLKNFFSDQEFISAFCRNYKAIFKRELDRY